MELRHLKYFVAVARTHSFSEAAKLLNITQSTLSSQIHQFENEVGVMLFERSTHSVKLTDYGEAIFESAERTLAEVNSCIDRINDVSMLSYGNLSIGCTYTFASILDNAILAFSKEHPHVKTSLVFKSVEELTEMLERQELDIVLSFKTLSLGANLISKVLFDTSLCAVVGTNHPLAKERKKSIRLPELEKYMIAMPAKGLQSRALLDKLLSTSNVMLNNCIESNDINTLMTLVKRANYLTFMSQASSTNSDTSLYFIKILHPDNNMQGVFTTRAKSYTKCSTREFIRILCEQRLFSIPMLDNL